MGNQNSSGARPSPPLSQDELLRRTKLTEDDIVFLKEKYADLSGSITKDGLIDMAEFQASLGFKEATTAARLFNCLDLNGDKMIDFFEFATGIAICAGNLGVEEMIRFSFKLYDLDSNGYIDKQELFVILRSAMMETATLELNERQLNDLVEQTLTMVSQDHDRISFEEYRELVLEQPTLLSLFSLNLAELKARPRKTKAM